MKWFTNNKYSNWYFNIIESAQKNIYKTHTEIHHIQPRSLGGNNDPTNLVRLPMREHFILHKLLPKMTNGEHKKRMISARWFMSSIEIKNVKYCVNSREYVKYKAEWVEVIRSRGNYDKIIHLLESGSRRPNEDEPLYSSVMYYLRSDTPFREYVQKVNPSWLVHLAKSGRREGDILSLEGEIFGELLVISNLPKSKYMCKCSCGKILTVNKHNLFRQQTCGHDNAQHLVQLNKNKMFKEFERIKNLLLNSDDTTDLSPVKKMLKSRSLPIEFKNELYNIKPSLRPRGYGSNNRKYEIIKYVKNPNSEKITTENEFYHSYLRFLKIDRNFFTLVDTLKPEWISDTLRKRLK